MHQERERTRTLELGVSQRAKRERKEQVFLAFPMLFCCLSLVCCFLLLCLLVLLVVLFVSDSACWIYFLLFSSLLFLVPSFIIHFNNANMHKNWRGHVSFLSLFLSLFRSSSVYADACTHIHM